MLSLYHFITYPSLVFDCIISLVCKLTLSLSHRVTVRVGASYAGPLIGVIVMDLGLVQVGQSSAVMVNDLLVPGQAGDAVETGVTVKFAVIRLAITLGVVNEMSPLPVVADNPMAGLLFVQL